MTTIPNIKRKDQYIERDPSRVICRLHLPGGDPSRADNIIQRVLRLDDQKIDELLEQIHDSFSERHKNIERIFEQHFQSVLEVVPSPDYPSFTNRQKLLLGACFSMEYSIESAALFNPSIVLHPDQSGLPDKTLRFIMSLRAVGEGHISSIVFRSGTIDSAGNLDFDPLSPHVDTPNMHINPEYNRTIFKSKLHELGDCTDITDYVMEKLPARFNYMQLQKEVDKLRTEPVFSQERQFECFDQIHWLVNSNYRLDFPSEHLISERVIFPVSEIESGGIEDARFVQFHEENGETVYYATYTAYSGKNIMPQLIETRDFEHFRVSTLNGSAVRNKGLALFPRKVKGLYAMLSRQDGENNYIMFSDDLYHWNESRIIQVPTETWEFIQIGNCGSPLETHRGWLVLTHGVGPMRVYSISAILLDIDDPTRVIARMKDPLIRPLEFQREGYVPNVVYTCGAIFHMDELIIPFSMSDVQSGIVNIPVDALFENMEPV